MTSMYGAQPSAIHEEHKIWSDEHRQWSDDAREWLRQLTVEDTPQRDYRSSAIQTLKEAVLSHLQAIQAHEDAIGQRDPAVQFYGVFQVGASEGLVAVHELSGKQHAERRRQHDLLKGQIDEVLE